MIKPKALNLIKDATPLPPPPYLSLEMGGGDLYAPSDVRLASSPLFFKRITTSIFFNSTAFSVSLQILIS